MSRPLQARSFTVATGAERQGVRIGKMSRELGTHRESRREGMLEGEAEKRETHTGGKK